jgi:hypothetical protein
MVITEKDTIVNWVCFQISNYKCKEKGKNYFFLQSYFTCQHIQLLVFTVKELYLGRDILVPFWKQKRKTANLRFSMVQTGCDFNDPAKAG